MIAGLRLAARPRIDSGINQAVRSSRRKHQMVDTYPFVPMPAALLVVPKAVCAGTVGMNGAIGVGQPQVLQAPKCIPGTQQVKRIILPLCDVPTIIRQWNDVVVAGEDKWLAILHQGHSALFQPLHPCELVLVF